jgi:hypothetical protein
MTIRVNVKTTVNNAKIRREQRNGRDVIVLPSATLPDNVVMNDILYPAEVIEKTFLTLERTPAPLGHPISNGMYLSAKDPEAINMNWIGAWNENVRREGGRVLLDKVVDVEVAKRHPDGERLLDAVAAGEPIHTSTGILMEKLPAPEGAEGYSWIASDMLFDHDAILLDEPGAAQPSQGVGIFVNSDGKQEELEVINSELPEGYMDFVTDMVMEEFERQERSSRWANIKEKLARAIQGVLNDTKADGLTVNQNDEGNNMPVTEEQFAALEKKVDTLVTNSSSDGLKTVVAEAVGEAVKPLQEQIDTINTRAKAEEEKQKASLVDAVVKANLLDEDTAKGLEINALQALADKVKPGKPNAIVGGFNTNAQDEDDQKFWDDLDLNANRKEA